MEILPYQNKDYEGVLTLLKEENWLVFFDTHKEEYKKALAQSITYVAKENERIIGFIRAISDGVYLTFIGELIVQKEFRKNHIGSSLIAHLESQVPCKKLELISDADAFYSKNHFAIVGTGQRKQVLK